MRLRIKSAMTKKTGLFPFTLIDFVQASCFVPINDVNR